ncbi:MAG: pantoate--beta-alanine ligase [Actinobacteria bacterium]|uniref:pantoate--beta-alanine ligase (AMP-forming) n=1 Tax=freshwater metagenome TaxID=449393 RepID=A0A6J6C0E2_9ZZZZ|nr:pantoate--beta-alanine ligase [Actinomycetota bacterium]
MILCHTVKELAQAVSQAKAEGNSIGFIPTMGALHEGHLSLVRAAQANQNFTIVSVFVNPLQFGEKDDFNSYPRTLGVDARLLTDAGVDVLFAPNLAEVFPADLDLAEPVPGSIAEKFEGEFRPGHFAGMLKVVSRLFDLVAPDYAYFGEKDAQQLALVKQMVSEQITAGRREPMRVVSCPTIRDEHGLALSSRNSRLSEAEILISRSLQQALLAGASAGKKREQILSAAKAQLSAEARLEYLELVDPQSFEVVEQLPAGGGLLIIAAWVGDVRLIDNLLIGG